MEYNNNTDFECRKIKSLAEVVEYVNSSRNDKEFIIKVLPETEVCENE